MAAEDVIGGEEVARMAREGGAAEDVIGGEEVAHMAVEGGAAAKRGREEEEESEGTTKKLRVETTSVVEENETTAPDVSLGPKVFGSSADMFNYFFKFLHFWAPNIDINKYEHMVILDLLKKGHAEPEKKIGEGIQAFQVRYHPTFKSRCFFLIRADGTSDDFSFRKCVDHILPLPENLKVQSASDDGKKGGGHGGGGWRGRGGGRGGRGRGRRGRK